MKRLLPFLAILLLAQTPTSVVLRTATGDKPVAQLVQNGVMYFAADDVIGALGGSVRADANGFKAPRKAPFAEQPYDDPYVKSVAVAGSDLRIQLTAPDVAADTYRLDNPFRIVIDLRKAAAPAPGAPLPSVTRPAEQPGIHTIVIDPGHGGKEVGAIGPGGLMEKDATLTICRKLADALEGRLHARVVLTRTDDSVVSLDQRTAVANQYHADLFLSVHMNAAVVRGAKGSEVYFLSLDASDELAKKAAETENANATAQRAPSNDLKLILWDLAQQQYLTDSSRFAQSIQGEMNRVHGI